MVIVPSINERKGMMAGKDQAVLRWEAPPQVSARRGPNGAFDPDGVIEALKTNRGEWAAICEGVSQGYVTTSKLVKTLKDQGCEVRSAKKNGTRVVYARMTAAQRGRPRKVA